MTKRERDVANRRAVIYIIMHSAPFSMITGDWFKLMIGCLNSQYCRETMHPSTIDAIIDDLHWEVDASISSILRCQRESCLRLGWRGPFIAIQADLTTLHNWSYATMSLSLVPESCDELVRLSVCTGVLEGSHTAKDIEEWIKEVHIVRW